MTKWTEVNVYTGRPVDEDAPTSFAGTGSGVDMNPTGMKKKKKLIDARSKSYKTHRARLEAARVKREAKRNSVKEEVKLDEKSPDEILFHFRSFGDAKKFNDYAEKSKQKLGIKQVIHFEKGRDVYASSVSVRPKDGVKLAPYETLHKELDKIAKVFKLVKSIKYLQNSVKEEVKLDEAKFKVGDIVIPSEGPHKGRKHEVIADLKNNTYNIRPIGLLAKQIQYRLGAAKAKANQIKLVKEEVKTKFSEKVIESVSEFNVESLLAEDNVDVLRSIVKNKAMKPIKLKDGTMKVDLFTASAIIQVLDKVKPANKTKLTKMLNGKKSDFMRAADGIMKMIGKKR